MPKTIIYYHRAYRKITGSGRMSIFELIAICIPLSLLILFGYPLITNWTCLISKYVLSSCNPPDTINIMKKGFLIGDVFFLDIYGSYPSAVLSFVNFIISLSFVVFLQTVKTDKNIAIYILFLAVINLVSSLFFIFSPNEFPYTVTEFSEFYIKSEISMWLFIPFILGMAVVLLPSSIFPKFILIIFALIYSIVFGTLRYVIFLFIVSKFSVIYMALLFFAFGPLIDFVYIVGIYSFYNSRLADELKGSDAAWKWSY